MFLQSSTSSEAVGTSSQTISYTENESRWGRTTTNKFTTVTNTDGDTGTSSSNSLQSAFKTLVAQTSTTSSREVEWQSTQTTSYSFSRWTTKTTETAETASQTFVFTTSSESSQSTATIATTLTESFIQATDVTSVFTYSDEETTFTYEDLVTVVANCYDTVVVAEGNEYILAMKSFIPAESWNGQGSSLDYAMITHGTSLTVSAFMHTSAAYDGTATQSIAQTITLERDVFAQTISESALNIEMSALPNVTSSFAKAVSSWSVGQISQQLDQLGKKTTTSYVFINSTYLNEDSVRRETPKRVAFTASTCVSPRYGTGNYLVAYPQANLAPFAVGIAKGSRSDALFMNENFYAGTCSVFGKKGVSFEGESGAFFTLANTTLSEVPFPLIGRAEAEIGLVKNGVYSLTTFSSPSWTISGKSVTYTLPNGVGSTTNSGEIGIAGEFTQKQLFARKSVLGGAPQPGETFVQYIPRGGYVDQNGSFTTFFDSVTTIQHPQSLPTMAYRYAPYLTLGNEALFWVSIERNPIVGTSVYEGGIPVSPA